MRKTLLIAVVTMLIIASFGCLGKPELSIGFAVPPPWEVKQGGTLNVHWWVTNEGKATANNVHISFSMPESFTDLASGTNKREIIESVIKPSDGKGYISKISVSNETAPGNYTIIVTISGENIPEYSLTPQVKVVP